MSGMTDMGLFGLFKKKVDKGAWIEALYGKKAKNPNAISEKELSAYTTWMLQQYQRHISESVSIIKSTKNEDTRQGRIEFAMKRYGESKALEPFCNYEQKVTIMQMEEMLRGIGLVE